MNEIHARATFPSIPSEHLDRFKELARACVAVVEEKDTGTLQYDWFLSPDGRTCVVREAYSSSDALMSHMGNLAEVVGEIIGVAGAIDIEIFGDPSDEVREAIAAFHPRIYSRFASL